MVLKLAMNTKGKVALTILILGLIAAFFLLDGQAYLNLGYLQQVRGDIVLYVEGNPVVSSVSYFLLYVLITALSVPGALVMTLAGGAVFGLPWGMLLVSFASTLGATLAMLVSRTLLRDWVQKRFTSQFVTVNQGWTDDGGFYLFSLRMVPLIPFFMVNLVMGLTGVSVWQFYWVSQVGMLAATFVFVFAGTQLAAIDSLSGILSPGLIVALSLLGLFPLLAKKSLVWLRRARARS
ncbi:MAG: TVP38/TMEM64 family protein [Gammaproteobacteria bacterium]|nr:TVP38/TMEM64 family protein [Gammaproteobacteria bacterium]